MSRYGMKLAAEYGEKLLPFPNQEEAEKTLINLKNDCLARLVTLANNNATFKADFTPESLKNLERWFFDLYENKSFENIGTSQSEFEICIAMYYGEVAVKNNKGKWIVQKYFLGNDKYTIGVKRGEFFTRDLTRYTGLPLRKNNKRKESIFREYQQYFGN